MKLKPLRLAFVARPPPWSAYRWIWLLAGCGALAMAILADMDAHRDLARARGRMAKQRNSPDHLAAPSLNAEERRKLATRVRAINAHIRVLNLRWDDIFRTLRPEPNNDVRLLALETSAAAGGTADTTLHISAEATGAESMTGFAAHLAQQPRLQNVTLVRHEAGRDAGAAPGSIRFRLEASWIDSL